MHTFLFRFSGAARIFSDTSRARSRQRLTVASCELLDLEAGRTCSATNVGAFARTTVDLLPFEDNWRLLVYRGNNKAAIGNMDVAQATTILSSAAFDINSMKVCTTTV